MLLYDKFFSKIWAKEETTHYNDYICLLVVRDGGNYISQDCFFEITRV